MQPVSYSATMASRMPGRKRTPPAPPGPPTQPKKCYDVVIVGAGGHGLATAYYLAKDHGITNVAVLERGWLAGGNMARNTTIIRSNYLADESAVIYEHSLRLWEGLADDLGCDLEFDQCGVLNLAHTLGDVREGRRRAYANRLNGIDAEWLDADDVRKFCPPISISPHARYPVLGATLQRRGGVANHDYVAWGLARAAASLGVDLIEDCEVHQLAVSTDGSRILGVDTAHGRITAPVVALAAAGHTSVLTEPVGLRLPLTTRPLQAMASELLEPGVLPCVVMSNSVHVYVHQAAKGELVIGAGVDGYNSYRQQGSPHVLERQLAALLELFPSFAAVRIIRTWAGIVDIAPDASPIIGPTDIDGLYVNCGWGTGGFKATPGLGAVYAATIAEQSPHPIVRPYGIDRFASGALIDEHGAAAVAH